MGDESRPESGPNRRFGLAVGFGLAAGMIVGKGLEKLLAPRLGEWGAFGVGLPAAAIVAGAVGLLVARRPGGGTGDHA